MSSGDPRDLGRLLGRVQGPAAPEPGQQGVERRVARAPAQRRLAQPASATTPFSRSGRSTGSQRAHDVPAADLTRGHKQWLRPRATGMIWARGRAMKYNVKIKKTDEGYAVWCPGLPGCWSEGKTEAEALENIRDAIAQYLAAADELSKDAESRVVEV